MSIWRRISRRRALLKRAEEKDQASAPPHGEIVEIMGGMATRGEGERRGASERKAKKKGGPNVRHRDGHQEISGQSMQSPAVLHIASTTLCRAASGAYRVVKNGWVGGV